MFLRISLRSCRMSSRSVPARLKSLAGGGAMRSIRCDRLGRRATGALLLLLVNFLGMARPAWAGCNHLVSSRSDRPPNFNQLDELITSGSPSLSDYSAGEQRPKHPTPCSGPSCSNRVPMPAPTTLPESDRSDQWGVLTTLALLPGASPPTRTVDETAGCPTGEQASIFHPPRG